MHDGTLYLERRQPGQFMPSLVLHSRTVRNDLTKGPRIPIIEAGILGMALALSLGGSLHCIGMCGGFAVLANAGARRVGFNMRFAAYILGKTLAYALLGAVLGLLGARIGAIKEGASVLAWLAGLAMIGVGGHLLGWPGLSRIHLPAASAGFVSRFALLVKKDSVLARLAMGVLNGWLPCGLVYAALAMSLSTGSFSGAVLFMTVFGLGTVPSLWVAAQLSAAIPGRRKARLSALSGWLVVLFGVYTILRGSGLMTLLMGGGHAMG